ncbi:MAG: adenine deaminase [Methanomicrobiales archaeon]
MKSDLQSLIRAARGLCPADLVVRNAELFDPFTCGWDLVNFAIKDGIVLGAGNYSGIHEIDCKGAQVVPGLIDSHVHIESSLLCPAEYARLVARHGTSTVIADPHEIGNVLGKEGIEYMVQASKNTAIDFFYMIPSCVPSTPVDTGGATLEAPDLAEFSDRECVLGLGEMMNVPGVLSGDAGIIEKLGIFSLVDGHAPMLAGNDLNAYILAGPGSDHECTGIDEAREKLSKGMYIYLREGSTEKNIAALLPVVTPCSVSRCSFSTDDRHADTLMKQGHIDGVIRTAVSEGLELELALRMATLSAAGMFGLHDRGAISPGRLADFSIVDTKTEFVVKKAYRRGKECLTKFVPLTPPAPPGMQATIPDVADFSLSGTGLARVIGIVPGQIITRELHCDVHCGALPDLEQDIIKTTVCSRYCPGVHMTGLVHGFSFEQGAIAGSVSHDAHNIIAAGTSDEELRKAIAAVIRNKGGLAAVNGNDVTVLPLENAGLMSGKPYEEVVEQLGMLHSATRRMGGIDDPFMYLSFLCLPVIPQLRLTVRGLFSVEKFEKVPLFVK